MNAVDDGQIIRIPYLPRRQLLAYHDRTERFAKIVAHRRFGKTVGCINDKIRAALRNTRENPPPRYSYVAPTYSQAKDIAWGYLKHYSDPIPGIVVSESELWIEYPNGARIRLYGADNYERMRGVYNDDVTIDEPAQIDPRAWPEVIRPTLADFGGGATFIGTPRGRDWFYYIDRHDDGTMRPDFFRVTLKASETGIIPEAELANIRRSLSENQYAQEFECFKPDALVMCHDRARPICEIVPGESVLTHTGRIRRVNRIIVREYSGDMVRISAYGSRDIVCTPDHPLYITSGRVFSWRKASDIRRGDYLVTPRMKAVVPVISAELAEVIAWYVCEGCVSGNSISFSIGLHQQQYVDELVSALDVIGFKSTVRRAANVLSVIVCAVELCDFLVGQCGSRSENKRIPLSLVRGREEVVWTVLFKGDGCIHQPMGRGHARKVYSYSTVSEGLAQQVQIIGASLGYSGTYSTKENTKPIQGRICKTLMAYTVQLRKHSDIDARISGKTRVSKNAALGMVREVTTEKYSGKVYNLSIQGDESYVVNVRAVHNCSFDAAIVGSYYGKLIAKAESEGRVCGVAYEPTAPVFTAWDLGIRDATAIWFAQVVGREVRLIDYYEASGIDLGHYVREIKNREYVYGGHILPHDAQAKELGTGKSRFEVLASLGLKDLSIGPRHRIEDGINAGRVLIPKCWFDAKKCFRGIEALKLYRTEYDDRLQALRANPIHDWTSHAADAFRYLAMSIDGMWSPETVNELFDDRGAVDSTRSEVTGY